MNGRLKRAWRSRQWFDLALAMMGFMMVVLGSCFFVFVSFIRAPIVPYGGLMVAAFGLWIGFLRPLWRSGAEPD